MSDFEYIVCEPKPNDKVKVLGRFNTCRDAIIFINGYLYEYDNEPKIELVLIRQDISKRGENK